MCTGLVNNIATGVFDFFYEPGAAIIRDPTAGSDEGLPSLFPPFSLIGRFAIGKPNGSEE